MNRPKAKGTRGETDVKRFLQDNGFPYVERRALHGTQDRGDISGLIGIVVEVKNCKTMALASWVDEAQKEKQNDKADIGVVWHHRRGKANPADWYVTMTGADFVHILHDLYDAKGSHHV